MRSGVIKLLDKIASCGVDKIFAVLQGTVELVCRLGQDVCSARAAIAGDDQELLSLSLEVSGNWLRAAVDSEIIMTAVDPDDTFTSGGAAFLVEEGCINIHSLQIETSSTGDRSYMAITNARPQEKPDEHPRSI